MTKTQNKQSKDIVAQYPDEFSELSVKGDEPGVWLAGTLGLDDRYFIHARATLPLKDTSSELGFGLWVEVDKEDFDRYLRAENDDEKYKSFVAKGKLANNWPGFEDTIGLKVTFRTIFPDEKVYITEVFTDSRTDPLFQIALLMQKHQLELKEQVKSLITAWMKDQQ